MKKKLMSILLCLSITAAIMPAAWADNVPALTLTNNDGTITAVYSGANGGAGDQIILAEYGLSGALKNMQTTDAVKGATLTTTKQNGRIYKAFAMNLGTMAPLCESAFYGEDAYTGTVGVPYIEGAVADATTTAVREYTDARLLIDELSELDLNVVEGDSAKLNEYLTKVDTAIAAYDDVMKSAAVLYSVAEKSAETQNTELASMEDADISLMATNEEQLHWAEELTKKYDAIQGANKLKQLGAMLGCDAREAYQQLAAAQDILRGKYMGDAEAATRWIKGLTVVKTGCKVGLLVGATVATAGAGGATLLEATGLIVNGVDTVIDVEKTTATLILGDEHNVVKKLEEKTKFISDTAFVFSILTLNTASDADRLAFLGDVNERVREKTGYSIDELNLKLMDGSLTMEILNKMIKKEDFGDIMSTPALSGKNFYENLSGAKDRLDEKREEITEETLKDILDEGDVIDKGSEQDEYDALFDSFEEVATQELDEKRADECDDEITYHIDKGTHASKYYTNKDGEYVGRREVYYEDVLTDVYMYDDDGKILSRTSYDYKTGRKTHYTSYTDGNNLGSIETSTQFYFDDSSVVTEQPHYVQQWVYVPYYNSDGERQGVTAERYYGNHYDYNTDGVMVEHRYGNGTQWTNTEGYDGQGNLSYTVESNGNGTHTVTYYFTAQPANFPFNPIGHIQQITTYYDYDYGYSYSQSQNGYEDSDFVSGEKWQLYETTEDIEDPETGNTIGYYKLYGYKHYPDSTKDSYEFEEKEREGPFYY